jgi:integrase
MRLNAPTVAKLTIPAGRAEVIYFDDALPGFGVRMRAGGKRTWIVQFRVGQKQRRITLGTVDAISADRARSAARDALAKAQLGNDPAEEKAAHRRRAAVTLQTVSTSYLEIAKARLRPRSYEEVERHFRSHWKALRETPIHEIDRAFIAARLKTISRDHGPFAANRARASLSAMFSWAMREGLTDANPVIATNKATTEVSRDRVLSDDELVLIWKHAGSGDYGRIIRLLMLTGQRREEIGGLRRPELNFDKALWSIPRERTKNGLPHDVPLSDSAIEILKAAPVRDGRELIFGEGEGGYSGWSKSKAALDARIEKALKDSAKKAGTRYQTIPAWRVHDLRRTAATRMSEMGILPHVVEAVLNHISGHKAGVAGIYNRATYAKEKRDALAAWAAHLSTLTAP